MSGALSIAVINRGEFNSTYKGAETEKQIKRRESIRKRWRSEGIWEKRVSEGKGVNGDRERETNKRRESIRKRWRK